MAKGNHIVGLARGLVNRFLNALVKVFRGVAAKNLVKKSLSVFVHKMFGRSL